MGVQRQTLKKSAQANWLFGHPVLRSTGVSQAYWAKSTISPYNQKGGGWLALLNGGVQTGANYAAIDVPVNEMPIGMFNGADWSYYMTGTETMGVNIVVWVHDGNELDNRAEVSQVGGAAGLAKAAGWNAHTFNPDTTQMFFYGENTTGTALTAGTQYKWTQFQSDQLFKNWLIYRISLEYGWEASGTFDPVWVAEVNLGSGDFLIPVPLVPTRDDLEAPVYQYATATTGALATALAPKTPFQLLSIALKINTAGTTSESFTASVDAGRGSAYDTNLITQNTLTPTAITSLFQSFGPGYDFMEDDEIDCAWANTENRTYGLTYAFRVLP